MRIILKPLPQRAGRACQSSPERHLLSALPRVRHRILPREEHCRDLLLLSPRDLERTNRRLHSPRKVTKVTTI